MFNDHLIFSNNIQDAARQLRLQEALSQKTKDDNKSLLDTIAKMDADRAARQAKVNPTTGKSYLDVANQATKDSLARAASRENYDELAKTAPNLAARARFGSESRAQSATPGAASGVAGQGGSTRYSDINAMSTLSAEDQTRVAPTLSTKRLEDMRAAQYSNSQDAARQGRGGAALGASKVSALNTINATIDSRKNNAMGGQAAAGSFARSWQEDPTSLRTQKSMAVRTDREKLAMNDALYQEGMKQFKEKGKLSQSHVDTVNQFSKFGSKPSDTLQQFGQATRQPLNAGEKPVSEISSSTTPSSAPVTTSSSTPAQQTNNKTFAQMQDERRYAQTNRLLNRPRI